MNPHDTADAPVRIPLHSRKYPNLFAMIDAEDADRVLKVRWHPSFSSSHTIYARGEAKIYLHRFVLGLSPCDPQVDHVNGDGLCNTKSNLRLCTKSQNQANRIASNPSTSNLRGVYWFGLGKKWSAQIQVNKKPFYLGRYFSEIEAGLAYDDAARKFFGEFARLNFPLEGEQQA